MTQEEALNLVHQVARQAPVNYQIHAQVDQAIQIIKKALEPKETPKKNGQR